VSGVTTHEHGHGHVHLDEAHWREWADQTESEGELLLAFVTDTARWVDELRGPDAPPVRRVIDIGSGPGVGTCELARLFPDAEVVAVDGSPAMLERVTRRAAEHRLDSRVRTHLAELPDRLDGVEPAEMIWASMSLHHVGDEVAALRVLRDLLAPSGLLAIAELADPLRVLPDELEVGRPGLAERLDHAGAEWFATMRQGLAGDGPSPELPELLASADLEVVGSRLSRWNLDAPLPDDARRVVLGHLRRTREQLVDRLGDDDLHALDVLTDAEDPRSVLHRSDVFVAASRQIVLARSMADG
jgi:SAM-dependent methyltransferase